MAKVQVTKKVTIGDLLSHQSGLPDHAGDLLEDYGSSSKNILERFKYINKFGGFRKNYAYTNFGYSEAAWATSKRLSTSWYNLSRRFFDNLNMKDTSYRYNNYSRASDKALQHQIKESKAHLNVPGRNPQKQSPAGGLSTNMNDFVKWLELMVNQGCYRGAQIIAKESLIQTQINQQYNKMNRHSYSYGWNVSYDQKNQVQRLSHSGAFEMGVRTAILVNPKKDYAIAVFTNAAWTGLPEFLTKIYYQLVEGIPVNNWHKSLTELNTRFKDEFDIYNQLPTKRMPVPKDLNQYLGKYINNYFGEIEIITTPNCLRNRKSTCLSVKINNNV